MARMADAAVCEDQRQYAPCSRNHGQGSDWPARARIRLPGKHRARDQPCAGNRLEVRSQLGQFDLGDFRLTAYPKTASEKGTVPFCSEDFAKSGGFYGSHDLRLSPPVVILLAKCSPGIPDLDCRGSLAAPAWAREIQLAQAVPRHYRLRRHSGNSSRLHCEALRELKQRAKNFQDDLTLSLTTVAAGVWF